MADISTLRTLRTYRRHRASGSPLHNTSSALGKTEGIARDFHVIDGSRVRRPLCGAMVSEKKEVDYFVTFLKIRRFSLRRSNDKQ